MEKRRWGGGEEGRREGGRGGGKGGETDEELYGALNKSGSMARGGVMYLTGFRLYHMETGPRYWQ